MTAVALFCRRMSAWRAQRSASPAAFHCVASAFSCACVMGGMIQRLALRGDQLVANPTVLCPICRSNFSGLHEARYPECGGNFTLDELAASQPQRDDHPAEL